MRIHRLIILATIALLLASCTSQRPINTRTITNVPTINLAFIRESQPNKFINLDYGIRLNVKDGRSYEKASRIVYKHDNYLTTVPQVNVYPEVVSFVNESMRRYMRNMGFNLDADVATDYLLSATIKEFNVNYLSGVGWSGVVNMEIEVYDNNRQLVYPNVSITGRTSRQGSGSDYNMATAVMNAAYANALEDIDWDRVAFFLNKASSPKLEGNKAVQGKGDTALESTVIRWYIDSSPQGADVTWRVVSSNPEVKNTNMNYVGSTPYESTETFDIKGLTYNNSGDVQIEVSCEKAGFITQKKRFNLNQVIDQKEISTKFNLVKDE